MTAIIVGFIVVAILQTVCLGAIALIWDQGEKNAHDLQRLIGTVKAEPQMPMHAAPPPRVEQPHLVETRI